MEAYIAKLKLESPWRRRDELCYRTLRKLFPIDEIDFEKEHPNLILHVGLDDCTRQIINLGEIFKTYSYK